MMETYKEIDSEKYYSRFPHWEDWSRLKPKHKAKGISEETHFQLSPVGGGFVYYVLKDKVVKVDGIPKIMIDDFAYFEDLNDTYPCLVNPFDRWNGWAKPYFEKKIVKRWVDDNQSLQMQENNDYILVIENGCEDGYRFNRTIIDQKEYYVSDGLCWLLLTDDYKKLNADEFDELFPNKESESYEDAIDSYEIIPKTYEKDHVLKHVFYVAKELLMTQKFRKDRGMKY